jgi:hypothetical protein
MHDGFRLERSECGLNFIDGAQIALDKFRARIDGTPMSFRKIIEDGNGVAFIEEQFGANAADVSCSADDKNFHRASCGAPVRRVKANRAGRSQLQLGNETAHAASASGPLFKAGNHSPNEAMLFSRPENFEALLL